MSTVLPWKDAADDGQIKQYLLHPTQRASISQAQGAKVQLGQSLCQALESLLQDKHCLCLHYRLIQRQHQKTPDEQSEWVLEPCQKLSAAGNGDHTG